MIEDTSGLFSVSQANVQHADHDTSSRKTGIPMRVQALLTPTKVSKMKPGKAIDFLRSKNVDIDKAMEAKIKTHINRQRDQQTFGALGITKNQKYTWGAVSLAVTRLQENNSTAGMHELRVVGEVKSDSQAKRLAVVLSTENLLLNARRFQLEGLNLTLSVDTTWSLVVEGHGTIVVGVVSPDQHFHAVSYGVCSHDDAQAHQHVFEQTKLGVEDVVRKYAREQLQF